MIVTLRRRNIYFCLKMVVGPKHVALKVVKLTYIVTLRRQNIYFCLKMVVGPKHVALKVVKLTYDSDVA
jgi:hypothetical protein